MSRPKTATRDGNIAINAVRGTVCVCVFVSVHVCVMCVYDVCA